MISTSIWERHDMQLDVPSWRINAFGTRGVKNNLWTRVHFETGNAVICHRSLPRSGEKTQRSEKEDFFLLRKLWNQCSNSEPMKFCCRMRLNYKEMAYIFVHLVLGVYKYIHQMYLSVHLFSRLIPEFNFSNLEMGRLIRKEIKLWLGNNCSQYQ